MPINDPALKRQRQRQIASALATLTGSRLFSLYGLGIAVGLMALAEWLPDVPFALANPDTRTFGIWKLLGSSVIIGLFIWLWQTKIDVRREYAISEHPPNKTRMLALLLSAPNFDVSVLRQHMADNTLTPSFFDTIGKTSNNWKMPLVAIAYHRPKLKRVFVVTSNGGGGSSSTFELFRQAMIYLHPGLDMTELPPGGVDFLDIKEVFSLLDKDLEYANSDLTIDLTGGHKLTSIAAAMLTFVEGRAFQYVKNDYEVNLYDIVPVE